MSVVTIHRVYPRALPPMRADKSALGTLPAAAYQYCEALRVASGHGWYIFPPCDITLKFDGYETFFKSNASKWVALTSQFFDQEYWDEHAPDEMKGLRIPYLTPLFVPGGIQIWSGLLVSTEVGFNTLVGPIANVFNTKAYSLYEGVVETDTFKPCPVFINIKLHDVGRAIKFDMTAPLFQLKPVHRASYSDEAGTLIEHEGIHPGSDTACGMSSDDWVGLTKTIRSAKPSLDHTIGSYGTTVRKRLKKLKDCKRSINPVLPLTL